MPLPAPRRRLPRNPLRHRRQYALPAARRPLRRRPRRPRRRRSCAALRAEVTTSTVAGHGAPALLPAALARLHTDITLHPARWTVPHRPGRHYPRYTIKKIRSRKPGDIVADHTSLHLLPLTAGGHAGAPCGTTPPPQDCPPPGTTWPAPAEVTPRPG